MCCGFGDIFIFGFMLMLIISVYVRCMSVGDMLFVVKIRGGTDSAGYSE